MAVINLQSFFRFAVEHLELVDQLYGRQDGVSEAELLTLIRRAREAEGPGAAYVRDRLLELGFITPSPHADAQFEMSRPVADLLRFLKREYLLTSPEVLRGVMTALEGYARELDQAVEQGNIDLFLRVALEVSRHGDELREQSRSNREEVIATAVRVKTNQERLPTRRRFELIARLWENYLVPLRDMIDTDRVLDATLDRLEGSLGRALERHWLQEAVTARASRELARLRSLRRETKNDFRECIKEITPLYEELRRESAIALGASRALRRAVEAGVPSLGLAREMGISNWQLAGQLSDSALEAYLAEVSEYRPARPGPIGAGRAGSALPRLEPAAFDREVRRALPLADLLAWLLATYPERSPGEILRLYGLVLSRRYGVPRPGPKVRAYFHGPVTFRAHPLSVPGPAKAAP